MGRTAAAWRSWYRSWEAQQGSFNPERERRFEAMLDVVAASLPERFTALDLGSGPGPLAVRLLRRFPKARCVAVDYDPVVLTIGRGAFGSFRGRLRWCEAKLGRPGWTAALPYRRFDAALSTTALHWLSTKELRRLYRDLAALLRRGGIVLNGDRLPPDDPDDPLARLAKGVRRVRAGGAPRSRTWSAWQRWWKDAERDPVLGPLFPERRRRSCRHPRHGDEPLSAHVRALERAGFRSVELVWRDLEDGVLYARR